MTSDDVPEGTTTSIPPLVDYACMGRRMRLAAAVLGGFAVVTWLVAIPFIGADGGRLAGLLGLAVLGMFCVEVAVVGGGALRGMLRAGERGDRLAGSDVGITPPQLTRRGRR